MKVSELSRRSGVSLPTIKFYIREGLLPAGQSAVRNRAEYGAQHLERLALIRALKDDAGLTIAAIARALRAADSATHETTTAAIDAVERPSGPMLDERSAEFRQALEFLVQVLRARGWRVEARDRSVRESARALALARRSFPREDPEHIAAYLTWLELMARSEIPDNWVTGYTPEAALRHALLGTVLFEPVLLALRRVAHVARARALAAQMGGAPEPPSRPPRRASPRKAARPPRRPARPRSS
jgi:DNA-binding transcriptional MerR regulator